MTVNQRISIVLQMAPIFVAPKRVSIDVVAVALVATELLAHIVAATAKMLFFPDTFAHCRYASSKYISMFQ